MAIGTKAPTAGLNSELVWGDVPFTSSIPNYSNANNDDTEYNARDDKSAYNRVSPSKRGFSPSSNEDEAPSKKKRKAARVPGGRAPVAKRIVADYDSEDEIIVTMKQQGYSDQAVRDELIRQGRTRYDVKTIPSRWLRIRKVKQRAEEEALDDELEDWHEDEDERLIPAYNLAKEKVDDKISKAFNKRWEFTQQNVNKRSLNPRFSGKACKYRYLEIMNGTARPPPELDPDPEARAREREERLRQKQVRVKEEKRRAAEEQRIKDEEKAAKEAVREAKRQQAAAIKNARAEERRRERGVHAGRVAAARRVREEKKAAMQELKEQRLREAAERKFDSELQKRLETEAKTRARDEKKARAADQRALAKQQKLRTSARRAPAPEQRSDIVARVLTMHNMGNAAVPSPPSAPTKGALTLGISSRAIMSASELRSACRNRGLPMIGSKEPKAILIARLQDADRALGVHALQRMLMEKGIPVKQANKQRLIRELAEADARDSINYRPGVPLPGSTPQPSPFARKANKPGLRRALPPVPAFATTSNDAGPTNADNTDGHGQIIDDNSRDQEEHAGDQEQVNDDSPDNHEQADDDNTTNPNPHLEAAVALQELPAGLGHTAASQQHTDA